MNNLRGDKPDGAGPHGRRRQMIKRKAAACVLGSVFAVLIATLSTHAQSTPAPNQIPKYELKDLTVEYGFKQGGQTGISAKITVATEDAAGVDSLLRITLLDEDEEPLEDTDGRFAVDGTVGAELKMKPTRSPMDVTLKFFIPYDDIEVIGSGEQTLMIDVDVVDGFGELVQHLGFHEFLFSVGSSESTQPPPDSGMSAVLSDVTVQHDAIEEGTGLRGIRIRFTADQVTGLKGIDAFLVVRFLEGGDSGEYVRSAIPRFADDNGELISVFPIKAGFDPARFSNVEVFFPYTAFPFPKGARTLDIDFDIIAKKPEEVFVHFGYKTIELTIK